MSLSSRPCYTYFLLLFQFIGLSGAEEEILKTLIQSGTIFSVVPKIVLSSSKMH